MLKSARIRSLNSVLKALKANPYLKKEDAAQIETLTHASPSPESASPGSSTAPVEAGSATEAPAADTADRATQDESDAPGDPKDEEAVSAYLKEHAEEITAEGEKPFQSMGGVVELLGEDFFPVTQSADAPETAAAASTPVSSGGAAKPTPALAHKTPQPAGQPKRENALQKINNLDVKGRIQLALKGNKEERSLLIRDGTKVVALAVLEAPKLSDGEVEKFASQKNVLEAVLRQIPLKRRFMKNYIVVRNLVANPRTPLDLGLGLMKNLLIQDLKNLSANKEVSETIRKLALKMYKQKLEAANKK
jgi:hypothetical protein